MKKRKNKKFDWNKFWKKYLIRFSYQALTIIILMIIGWMLGLKLVRY